MYVVRYEIHNEISEEGDRGELMAEARSRRTDREDGSGGGD